MGYARRVKKVGNVMWRRAISLVILAGHVTGEPERAVELLIRASLAHDGRMEEIVVTPVRWTGATILPRGSRAFNSALARWVG